jgi:hypothetical protein
MKMENNEIKDVFDFENRDKNRDRLAVAKFVYKRQIERAIYIGEEKLFISYKHNTLLPISFHSECLYNEHMRAQNERIRQKLIDEGGTFFERRHPTLEEIHSHPRSVQSMQRHRDRLAVKRFVTKMNDARKNIMNPNWFVPNAIIPTKPYWDIGFMVGSEALMTPKLELEINATRKVVERIKARGWWENMWFAFIGKVF